MSAWQQWTRLRARLTQSFYSQQTTVRDWSVPEKTAFRAMMDPATNNLYIPAGSGVDFQSTDRFIDPAGNVWHIDTATPTAADINLVPQNPIQVWGDPFTGWTPGTVIRIARVTP